MKPVNKNKKNEEGYFHEGVGESMPELDEKWLNNHKILYLCAKNSQTNLKFARAFNGEIWFNPRASINHIKKEERLENCINTTS